jgi:hypothetical protein
MKKKKRRPRKDVVSGRTVIVWTALAIALVIGTGLYINSHLSRGGHFHLSLQLILLNVLAPLIAAWMVWDWWHSRHRKR